MTILEKLWALMEKLITSAPASYQILLIISLLIIGVLSWAVKSLGKKVLDSHLKTISTIEEKLNKHSNKIENFEVKLDEFISAIQTTIAAINDDGLKIKTASLEFQKEVNTEINYLRKLYLQMEASIDRVHFKADSMHKKFDDSLGDIKKVFSQIEIHQAKLAELAEISNGNIEAVEKVRQILKTLIIRLGKEFIWIKGEEVPTSRKNGG
jgi:hypothetical protein